jgi:hypothetical protein
MPWLIPREHGAWAMLVTPFVAAVVLAREVNLAVAAAAVAVLAVFLAREPMVLLGRRGAAAPGAWRWLGAEGAVALFSGLYLWRTLPREPLIAMGIVAAVLTAVSIWMLVHNRQRSTLLQLASAAGLNMSALLAWLAARGSLAPAAWWLAVLMFAHSAAAVLVVHARLDYRIALKRDGAVPPAWSRALAFQLAPAALGVCAVAMGRPWLALAPLVSVAVHTAQLLGLRRPDAHRVALQRVGKQAMMLSIAYSLLVLAALW